MRKIRQVENSICLMKAIGNSARCLYRKSGKGLSYLRFKTNGDNLSMIDPNIDLKGKSILVTWAAGFIGSYLVMDLPVSPRFRPRDRAR